MAVKKCCVPKCSSCSARIEDIGVSYHKFPKDISLHKIWTKITCLKLTSTNTTAYVCSRHFCKSDFQINEDSNYLLKSDAVPSIFPWKVKMDKSKMETTEVESKELNSCKDLDGDNLEDIKKFIEDEGNKLQDRPSTSDEKDEVEMNQKVSEADGSQDFDERLAVASSMMDMILSESEEQLAKNRNEKSSTKQTNQGEKGNSSMALSVGSKVEARDFGEYWYPAKITEVDYEEMEVLVHYENASKKHDEWISVNSPRLRPLADPLKPSTPVPEPEPAPGPSIPKGDIAPAIKKEIKEEPRMSTEEKPRLLYKVGERCLARWRDNRRFMATISKDLGKGHYEVVFDDGFQWKCTTCRLYKVKVSGKAEGLTIDTPKPSIDSSAPSPVKYGAGPSTPAFHTHLFDPTRDYLGSKSERREMKRKLNIKEIFNIGQKRPKKSVPKDVKKPIVVEKKRKINRKKKDVPTSVKTEIPDAVASIIGTFKDESVQEYVKKETQEENITEEIIAEVVNIEDKVDIEEDSKDESDVKIKEEAADLSITDVLDIIEKEDSETSIDTKYVQEEEVKLEKFEKLDDTNHEEVIDRIKEVINKLEDGISKVQNSPKIEVKEELPKVERAEPSDKSVNAEKASEKVRSKKLSKVKKGKKLRLLQEKKVKKQVEKVKSELEEMKRQVEEMRQQMLARTEELAKGQEMPESFLLPGEWCCRWVNGQPVGKVSQLEAEVRDGRSVPGLPRRSVQVDDKRLPPGWTKHMVRRSLGNSAGKWDVVLVNSENRRFHTKTDMRNFMEGNTDETLRTYEQVLMDFGVHLKLARRMGWVSTTPGGVDETPVISLPAGTLCSTSPLVKRRKLNLIKKVHKDKGKKRKLGLNIRMPKYLTKLKDGSDNGVEPDPSLPPSEASFEEPPLEDGYVYVGSLKVQIIENLLRCPAEGCYKNFRNNTLIKMHIKHYHRELRKMLGRTPKVLDLAYARTMPVASQRTKVKNPKLKGIKIKLPKLPKRAEETKLKVLEPVPEIHEPQELPVTPIKTEEQPPRLQDSPKLRLALINKPVKRPRVLLPVRRPEPSELELPDSPTDSNQNFPIESVADIPIVPLDFETAISTHTVTKPSDLFKKKEKKNRVAILPKVVSEEEDWFTMNSDIETRSSFPRSGTPDSKNMDQKLHPISSESNEELKQNDSYMYTDTGERIKIVHMKREEIINCHCGFREEDGLMVQCELCLCWQHALCHNIQKESEVPEKYTCSICLNPRRGRRSQRFLHDQDRLYEGLLPGTRPSEPLRRSHELSGNLLRIQDALHALRVKYYVATKKNHPKLYLWAKDWENGELNITQERLNSDYSELSVMMGGVGKENLPLRPDDLDIQTPPSEDHDRYSQREGLGSSLLGGLLASPGGALEHGLGAAELERLARTVQDEVQRVAAPQPEAAIENGACRERLLRHIQRCQAVLDARLDSIEAQVAELESQDPSFEDDETADYFPRTKQTIQMLMRDLDTMEELGVIT